MLLDALSCLSRSCQLSFYNKPSSWTLGLSSLPAHDVSLQAGSTQSIPMGLDEHRVQCLGLAMDDTDSVPIIAIKNETRLAPRLLGGVLDLVI